MIPVILSGGSGTRLWPISRKLNPKQFLDFFGDRTLFSQTILRTKDNEFFNPPIAVCNNEHRFIVAEEFKKSKIKLFNQAWDIRTPVVPNAETD